MLNMDYRTPYKNVPARSENITTQSQRASQTECIINSHRSLRYASQRTVPCSKYVFISVTSGYPSIWCIVVYLSIHSNTPSTQNTPSAKFPKVSTACRRRCLQWETFCGNDSAQRLHRAPRRDTQAMPICVRAQQSTCNATRHNRMLRKLSCAPMQFGNARTSCRGRCRCRLRRLRRLRPKCVWTVCYRLT